MTKDVKVKIEDSVSTPDVKVKIKDNTSTPGGFELSSDSSVANEMFKLMLTRAKDIHEYTLEESLSKNKEKIVEQAESSRITVKDSYSNSLLSIGEADKSLAFDKYSFYNDTNNYTLWMSLYNCSWVFRRAIDKPAQDEIRSGINLLGDLKEEQKLKIERMLSKQRKSLIKLCKWGALFGGAVGVIMFDNFRDDDYKQSITKNLSKIKQAKTFRIYVTDRWYGCAPNTLKTVRTMKSLDYGKPVSYDITFANGKNFTVHHDYILRYEHYDAPNLVQYGQLQGWGYAEGAHIFTALSRDDKLTSSIQSLIDKSLIEVIKMDGMRGIFMSKDAKSKELMEKRLQMVNWARNFNSLTFLDSKDDYQMNSFSGLAGLADLLEKNMWIVSAALNMQGVLFGDLKQGFSNDVDAMERYSETIMERNEDLVRPVLEKLLYVTYIKEGITTPVEFEFNSIIKKKLDKDNMEGLDKFSITISRMLQDGVITPRQYAESLKRYQEKGKIDFGFDDAALNALDDKVANEMENIKIDEPEEEETDVLKSIKEDNSDE